MSAKSCPSLRFASHCPSGDQASRALGLLWARDVTLARAVEAASMESKSDFELITTGASVSVRVPDISGLRITLHSPRDPQREADEWVESLDLADDAQAVIVMGFGLGYHVRSILAKLPDNARLFVYEPDARLLWLAIEQAGATDLIEDRRLKILCTIEKSRLLDEWMKTAITLIAAPKPIEHPASVRRDPEGFAGAKDEIQQVIAFLKTSINTVIINGKTTATNVIANLACYASHGGMERLRNHYRGCPAIIVAAGPSLRKNLHLLKAAVGKAVIIAVQTSFQMLLDSGIEPTFVTSLDYHEIIARFFERVPQDCGTELIVEPKATSRVPVLHTGPISFVGSDYADDLLREMKLNRPRLRSGATVAHLSFYLAEYLGCDTTIFIGQDLSFSDGVFYTPGTMHEDVWRPELSRFSSMEMKQWEMIARDRAILRKVPAAAGGHVWTEERMFSYLQQFERDFANTRCRVIDATEGGALKAGATPMTLANAIDRFCKGEIPAKPPAINADERTIDQVRTSLGNRVDEARQISRICQRMLPLLEVIESESAANADVNRAVAEIDQLRESLPKLMRTYEQIMLMSQLSELERCRADLSNESGKFDGRERQRRQARRDMTNMNSIIAATRQFEEIIAQQYDLAEETKKVAA